MVFVDTNILLRWLLGDQKELTAKAEALIEEAEPGSLLVTDVVVAEIVYVLRSTGRDRKQTSEALLLIGRTPSLRYEHEELTGELVGLLATTKLDFADCYLLTRARRENAGLETFDAALRKRYLAS